MVQNKSILASPFPIKVFTFALVLTITLFAGLSWLVFSSYKEFETTKTQDFRLQELNGIITHLDEVLTMSARMAVATGDLQWEERYRSFEPHLNTAIKEATRLAPETFMSKAAARTDAANIKLVAMENRAFDLVRHGNRKAATALLYGEEYEEQKLIYAKGMQQIALAMQERIEAALYAKRQQAFFTVISAIVALPILLFAWIGVLGTVRKRIAERKQAVDALQESEKFFLGTLNDLLTFVGVLDPSGKVIFVNNTPIEIAGIKREDVMGKMLYDTYWWAHSEEVRQTIKEDIKRCASGETFAHEIQVQMAAGSLMWVEFSMHPIYDEEGKIKYLVPEGRDITVRKQLETQLRHAQKMEAIGQLAGGIAHDFNNILTAIMSYGNILLMKMGKDDDTLRTYVDAILTSSERAAALTRGLLSFSRKQIINPLPIDLNNIIKKSESLLSGVICEDIEFRTELTDKDLLIVADSGQIEQVLMNLATNARDAMPDGGILTINTERVELDNKYIKTHGYGKPGTYALLSVTDTGTGMDDETRERIFEPFFTTKEVGKGTGLGLAIVYGIIKQHNGYINVYSEKEKGTTCKIYLPLIKEKVKEEKPAEAPLIGGTETVLVAEDESAVRLSLKLILEEYGFTVIEAVNGEDAIEKFMENKEKIQLLILDVVMPKKKGKEVYEEIKKVRPDIKAIFTSGYTEGTIHANGTLEKGLNFISKPVSPNDLLRKIREVLDR